MNRKLFRIVAACFGLALLGSFMCSLSADNHKPWSLSTDFTVNSKYVSRGLNTVDDVVFQPSISVGYENFSTTLWGNMELTDENQADYGRDPSGEFTEINWTLDWASTWGENWNIGAGFIHYLFPNTGGNPTSELYATAGYNVFLNPTVTLYWDVDELRGVYMNVGVSHSFEDVWSFGNTSVTADLYADIGWSSKNYAMNAYGATKARLTDFNIGAKFPFALNEYWTITPHLCYSALIASEIKDNVAKDNNFWAGVSATYSF